MVVLYIPGIPVNQIFPDGDLPGHPVMIGNKIIIPFARFPFGEVLKRLPAAEAGGRNAQRLFHGGDELILGKGSAINLQGLRKICAGILDHQQRAGGSGALQRLALGDAEVGAVVCGDDDGRAVIKPQVLQLLNIVLDIPEGAAKDSGIILLRVCGGAGGQVLIPVGADMGAVEMIEAEGPVIRVGGGEGAAQVGGEGVVLIIEMQRGIVENFEGCRVGIIHVVPEGELELIGHALVKGDAEEDLLQAGEIQIAEVRIIVGNGVGDIGIGQVGDEFRIRREDADIRPGVGQAFDEPHARGPGLVHINGDGLVHMALLRREEIGQGGIGAVIAAGGVGIPDPAGKGVLQLRPALQHLLGIHGVRRVEDEDDGVLFAGELELPGGGEDVLLLADGGIEVRGEDRRDEADELHDGERRCDGAHGKFGGLAVRFRKEENQNGDQQQDRDPDDEVIPDAGRGDIETLAGEGDHVAVHEKNLQIGCKPEGQGKPRHHQARPRGKQHQDAREEQGGQKGQEKLQPPDIAEGNEEFTGICQQHLQRRKEEHRQSGKQIAKKNRNKRFLLHVLLLWLPGGRFLWLSVARGTVPVATFVIPKWAGRFVAPGKLSSGQFSAENGRQPRANGSFWPICHPELVEGSPPQQLKPRTSSEISPSCHPELVEGSPSQPD